MSGHTPNPSAIDAAASTQPVQGRLFEIGSGFSALSFDHSMFGGLMDPLVMVDHFTMTGSTFGPHPHAGMSAVSIIFEDSTGFFHNRDSLGNDIDLGPGDLYWLKAGRGAVHDEKPRAGSKAHALQAFVNLPARLKADAPVALHVPASEMPTLRGDGFRVRVVLGASGGVQGAASPAIPFTVLDVHLDSGGAFAHEMPADADAWLLAVRGEAEISVGSSTTSLRQGSSMAVRSGGTATPLAIRSQRGAHLALLQGTPIREPFVQEGPFVMANDEDMRAVVAAHAAGELGTID